MVKQLFYHFQRWTLEMQGCTRARLRVKLEKLHGVPDCGWSHTPTPPSFSKGLLNPIPTPAHR